MLKTHGMYYVYHDLIIILEPVILNGEGEYNLNALIEVKVTESYLGLDGHARECQMEEPFYNCTTRHYVDTLLKQCGCLPLNIRISNKVCFIFDTILSSCCHFRNHFAHQWNLSV